MNGLEIIGAITLILVVGAVILALAGVLTVDIEIEDRE